MPLLIGVAGKARVGKDTAANFLAHDYLLERYAFAKPLKEAMEAMGFSREEYDTDEVKDQIVPDLGVSYRYMLQTLGTEWGRSIHRDFWLILAQRYWAKAHVQRVGLVISDVRFNNEADWIRREGGLLLHIEGPSRGALQATASKHRSEDGITRLLGDVVIYNLSDRDFLQRQLRAAVEGWLA